MNRLKSHLLILIVLAMVCTSSAPTRAQDIAGPSADEAMPMTPPQQQQFVPGMVPPASSPMPTGAPMAGNQGYQFMNPRQAAAARGVPTASMASPASMTLSSPPTATDLEKANRKLSATIQGSMCFSCLVKLRNELRSIDGVIAVDMKLSRANANSPRTSKKKTAFVNVFYDGQRTDSKSITRLMKSRDFNLTKSMDQEFFPGSQQ